MHFVKFPVVNGEVKCVKDHESAANVVQNVKNPVKMKESLILEV